MIFSDWNWTQTHKTIKSNENILFRAGSGAWTKRNQHLTPEKHTHKEETLDDDVGHRQVFDYKVGTSFLTKT